MAAPERKNRLLVITIIAALTLSFWGLYYLSTDSYRQRSEVNRIPERQTATDSGGKTAAPKTDRLVLKKDERIDVGRTSLIYKGIEDSKIVVDLYLLDLDPKQGYLKKIEEDKAEEGVLLGPVTYRLISANDSYLTLKIVNMTHTP